MNDIYFGLYPVNVISISHGIGIGWLSPTLRKLQSDSPAGFEVKSEFEISWVGSMLGMGSVTGNILIGCLLGRLGSKRCLLLIAIPHSVICQNRTKGIANADNVCAFSAFGSWSTLPRVWSTCTWEDCWLASVAAACTLFIPFYSVKSQMPSKWIIYGCRKGIFTIARWQEIRMNLNVTTGKELKCLSHVSYHLLIAS